MLAWHPCKHLVTGLSVCCRRLHTVLSKCGLLHILWDCWSQCMTLWRSQGFPPIFLHNQTIPDVTISACDHLSSTGRTAMIRASLHTAIADAFRCKTSCTSAPLALLDYLLGQGAHKGPGEFSLMACSTQTGGRNVAEISACFTYPRGESHWKHLRPVFTFLALLACSSHSSIRYLWMRQQLPPTTAINQTHNPPDLTQSDDLPR